jgi:polyadenylate-binding protein
LDFVEIMATVTNPAKAAYPSTSLYVGDLSPEVNEALLFEIFNAVGPVASIRVCRDNVTRQSLGYAYVNFHNVGDAERALDTMNYTNIGTRPCRIMWSQRDPALRKSGVGNIFVKNLDKSIDHKTLFDTFSVFGNILSCKVSVDSNGESLGYGFVHYQTAEAAEKAITQVNGMVVAGQKVTVEPFKPRSERSGDHTKFTNVYVKNLPESFNKQMLEEMFGKVGTITSSMVPFSADGKFRGFAFVNYEEPDQAQAAIHEFNDMEYEGKKLYVGRAMKKSERQGYLLAVHQDKIEAKRKQWEGRNLYVKNLSDTLSEEKFIEEFSQFGSVTSAKIILDPSGKSRGFGFICFETSEMAARAYQEMNGKMFDRKPLYVAYAQRRDDRRKILEKQRREAYGMPSQIPYPGAPMYYPQFPAMAPNARAGWPAQGAPVVRPMYPAPMGAHRGRGGRGRGAPRGGGRGGRGGRDMGAGPAPQPIMTPHVQVPAAGSQLTQLLANASPHEQKQIIGERLFPLIREIEAKRAGKITGMLLEMDNSDLLELLSSKEALLEKVQEAITVLQAHETNAQ